MNRTYIPVCFTVDNHYFQHLTVTVASILKNKRPDDFYKFYILETSLSPENRKIFEALKNIADFDVEYLYPQFDPELVKLLPLNNGDHFNITAYYRLMIPELIQEEKIIYLDCDIVVLDSLANLYHLELGDNYILGVKDIIAKLQMAHLSLTKYINSGVLVLNSAKIRKDRITAVFFDWIKQHHDAIVWHDQDVLNATLHHKIAYIDDKWNCQIIYADRGRGRKLNRMTSPSIIHYIGSKKPWHPDCFTPKLDYYFDYLRLTPFSDYEKGYREKRKHYIKDPTLKYRLKNILKKLISPVYSKEKSPYETYYKIRFLGLKFNAKRHKR